MEDTIIEINNVSKQFLLPHEKKQSIKSIFTTLFKSQTTFSEQKALQDINIKIKRGEFFGIVGRNGSGKSTLLKIIAGIYQPTTGEVRSLGKIVPFIELGVGFNPELSGRENVYLNGALLGFSHKEIDEMYKTIIEFAELEDFMDQKLKNYSSGMQVRLAFSCATMAKADILLIDEVLAVGDADFQRKCYEYFQRIKSEGITVIFVTHDMGAIRQYCDRVALIDSKRLIDINDAETVAKKYVKLFSEYREQNAQPSRQSKRWGNKKAIYKKVMTKLVDNGENILLTMLVEAREDILDPTFGFMVANEVRQPILGSNTNIEQVKIKPLRVGQEAKIQWKLPNIFNEGRFYIELVIMYKSVTEVADWWEDAKCFSITNEKRTPYIVNPPIGFSIE